MMAAISYCDITHLEGGYKFDTRNLNQATKNDKQLSPTFKKLITQRQPDWFLMSRYTSSKQGVYVYHGIRNTIILQSAVKIVKKTFLKYALLSEIQYFEPVLNVF